MGNNRKIGVSGYRGVTQVKGKYWVANYVDQCFKTYLGCYPCRHMAAMVIDMFQEENHLPPYGNTDRFEPLTLRGRLMKNRYSL